MARLFEGAAFEAADAKARAIKADFPILVNAPPKGIPPLVYLDSAASSQKPRAVIDAIVRYYENTNSNVHRSIHRLGEEATAALESSRKAVARFIGASSSEEIVFTRGTTESFNLLASSLSKTLSPGDEIVVSIMEHHANIVPWQMAAKEKGLVLKFAPIDDRGDLDLDALAALIGPHTKLMSLTHVSNLLGTVNPISRIARMAHEVGALFAVDAAQSAPHMRVDVSELGADFLAFSGHKLLAPMGIGVLYGRRDLLEALPPYQGGGEMISNVTTEGFSTNELPWKFEAGTPNVEGAVGLEAALSYLGSLDLDWIESWTSSLADYAARRLALIPGVRVHGSPRERSGLFPFTLDGVHSHDLAAFLDKRGVAVRAGKHCAHPLADLLGLDSSCRASFYAYSTKDDADALVAAVSEASECAAAHGGML
jgi:cysteine desulfurase/selenocysteine lyase